MADGGWQIWATNPLSKTMSSAGSVDPASSSSSPISHRPSAILAGLMSGTSLDGISAAVVRFKNEGAFDLLAFRQLPFDANRRQRLAAALAGATPDEYCRLNFDLGHWLADAAIAVLADAGIARDEIAAIA